MKFVANFKDGTGKILRSVHIEEPGGQADKACARAFCVAVGDAKLYEDFENIEILDGSHPEVARQYHRRTARALAYDG